MWNKVERKLHFFIFCQRKMIKEKKNRAYSMKKKNAISASYTKQAVNLEPFQVKHMTMVGKLVVLGDITINQENVSVSSQAFRAQRQ